MGTPSGFAFFLDLEVNKVLKKILNAWAEFLGSPDSAYVLGSNSIGWFSPHGTEDLAMTATRAAKIPAPHEVNTLYVQNNDLPIKNKRHKISILIEKKYLYFIIRILIIFNSVVGRKK